MPCSGFATNRRKEIEAIVARPVPLPATLPTRLELVDSQFLRDGPGRLLVVARKHDDPQSELVERADRLGRGRFDRIGYGDQTGELLIDEGEHALNPGRRSLSLLVKNTGAADYAVSRAGSLVFAPAVAERAQTLGWVARDGVMTTPLPPPSRTRPPRTRRNTRRLATEGASRSATAMTARE